MRKMTHVEIREMWFKFFTSKHHQIIESAPLIPIECRIRRAECRKPRCPQVRCPACGR